MSNENYLGNPLLKGTNVQVNYTQEQVEEYLKCAEDPVYFIEKYIKVVNLDHGLVDFNLYPFQKRIVETVHKNRFTICKIPRQSGKSITVTSYLLHYCLFNPNVRVAILANKGNTAKELLDRFKTSYENLPRWLQQGIVEWNKFSVQLENGSKIISAATSSSAVRGGSFNCISGDSIIRIKNTETNQEYDISIKDFYANSSRSSENYKYIHESNGKQIQEMVLFSDEESTKKNIRRKNLIRKSPYYSSIFGWKKYQTEFSEIDNQRTSIGSSLVAEISYWCGKSQNDTCIFSHGSWSSGIYEKHESERSNDINATLFRGKKNNINWIEKIRNYKEKNIRKQYGKENFRRNKKEIISCNDWKICWEKNAQRIWYENFKGIEGAQENKRTFGQNQQKSRKDSQNSRKTPWDETFGRSQRKDETIRLTQNTETGWSMEQGNENDKWEVYTSEGWKPFYGITKTYNRDTISIKTEIGTIKCTPDHKISTTIGFIEAKNIKLNTLIETYNKKYVKVISIEKSSNQDVYDLLHVDDVHSFYANNILVHNCIVLDEFAYVPTNFAEDFFSSVYPTISSGKNTKCIIISTPKGLNHFYKTWVGAVSNKNSYVPIEANWYDVPGRDAKFKQETIANTSEAQWNVEYECEFLGSDNTLISPSKIANMVFGIPVNTTKEGMDIYEYPQKDHIYSICVDTSRGDNLDYHAFVVIDCTQMPYRQVAKFRNNTISYQLFPHYIKKAGDMYNEALVLLEINDLGQVVADILHEELEYGNILTVSNRVKKGQKADGGFGSGKAQMGVRMSGTVKKIGCGSLKDMIENDRLIIQDFETISEFSTYVSNGTSYEASEGYNDDLISCLVMFGWKSTQTYFKDFTNTDVRKKIYEEQIKKIEEEISPFGFSSIEDDIEDPAENRMIFDERNTLEKRMQEFRDFNFKKKKSD